MPTDHCKSSCERGMQAAFRIARSRILIDALLEISELNDNRTLQATLLAIHGELVQASRSLAIPRIPTLQFTLKTGA